MKIFINNAVYVQKNDIIYLNSCTLPIPCSIFDKAYNKEINIIDNNNKYEFIKFDQADEIEFFKNLSWIINYDDVKNLSDELIIKEDEKICIERNNIAIKWNELEEKEKEKNKNMILECELLDYKMDSLKTIFWFRKGKVKMILPEGVNYPTNYNTSNNKSIKKLVKSIFKSKK